MNQHSANDSDRVILVTGASGDIGSAIARAFAVPGARVLVHYHRHQDAALQVVCQCQQQGAQAWALSADLSDPTQVQQLVAQISHDIGRLDVIVHNAFAAFRFDPDQRNRFWDLNWDAMQHQLDGTLRTCFELCQAALPLLRAQGSGSIVLLGSDLVSRPTIAYPGYTTAKAALQGLARQMAADLGPLGIRVNTVAPGLVQGTRASRHTPETVVQELIRLTPMGRIATVHDVASAVRWLSSDEAAFITGQTLHVDGGLVMN